MNEIIKRFDTKIELDTMTKYGNILKFIKPLEEYRDKLGYFQPGGFRKDKDGNDVLTFGFPIYESDTIDFLDSVRQFFVYDYVETIESYGIKYENIDIHKLDLSKYDDKLILAMLTAIIRSDRVNEGLILSMIENGSILKLLKRLKDFDTSLLKEDIITKIEYSVHSHGDFTKNEGIVIKIFSKEEVRVEYSSCKIDNDIQPVKLLDKNDSKELINKLNSLNILEWKEHYEPEDEIIMDGESWHMDIDTYNLGTINKNGYNAFPHNWHAFRNFRRWIFNLLKIRKEII